jgi:hypothetical protein
MRTWNEYKKNLSEANMKNKKELEKEYRLAVKMGSGAGFWTLHSQDLIRNGIKKDLSEAKSYTIKQKQSNSGTIHDLASDQYDRVIKFNNGAMYALVLPSYFGDRYTTAKSEKAIITKAKKESNGVIIDVKGNEYSFDGSELRKAN